MRRTSKSQLLDTTSCLPVPNPPDGPRDNPPKDEPPEAKSDQLTTDYQKHNLIPHEPLGARGKARTLRGPPPQPERTKPKSAADIPLDPRAFGLYKVAYSVLEFIALVGISRASIYEAAAAGDLQLTKMGKRSLILAIDGAAFLHALRERRASISHGFRRGWGGKPNPRAPSTVTISPRGVRNAEKSRSE
jgi:hypothetical protein